MPVADFTGDAFHLATKYDGASSLATYLIESVIRQRPGDRVQVEGFFRKGRLRILAMADPTMHRQLSAELLVTDRGNAVTLSTIDHPGLQQQETWDVTWVRRNGGEYQLKEAVAQTLTTTESALFPDGLPEFGHTPTDAEVAGIGGLSLRAALAYERYALELQSLQPFIGFRIGRVEDPPIVPTAPGDLPEHGSV